MIHTETRRYAIRHTGDDGDRDELIMALNDLAALADHEVYDDLSIRIESVKSDTVQVTIDRMTVLP